jgi:crotonobetainyl-CoA:carnitine CoA-transferase CaiB-like acyl-CoA transferase
MNAAKSAPEALARSWPDAAPGDAPLCGLRVLDLTRILAGPVAGRTLAARRFGPDAPAALKHGIVVVSLPAYGAGGPWGGRRGFDSLAQTATGLNLAEAQALCATQPRALPMQILDCAADHRLAFGALAAPFRQRDAAGAGGGWQVRGSQAAVRAWQHRLARAPGGPAARFSITPPRWVQPWMPPGSRALRQPPA